MRKTHIDNFDVLFTKEEFPVKARYRREVRGIHAQIAQHLMDQPNQWAKIAKGSKKLSEKQYLSLSTSLHSSVRFGLSFAIHKAEDGHTYAKFLGKTREVKPKKSV